MYGWRGRIGHIYPSGGLTGEQELAKMAPEGVALYTTRVKFSKATREQEEEMGDLAVEAASLLADARVDLIAFNCTTASLIKGPGYDRELIDRITQKTSIQATTTTTAVLEALRILDVGKLVLATAYVDEFNEVEADFLEAYGYHVIAKRGLGLRDPYDQAFVSPEVWYELVMDLRNPGADAYFVSCAGIEVVGVIERLEEALGMPVITSNQALMFDCLTRLGVKGGISGYGTLLRDYL